MGIKAERWVWRIPNSLAGYMLVQHPLLVKYTKLMGCTSASVNPLIGGHASSRLFSSKVQIALFSTPHNYLEFSA